MAKPMRSFTLLTGLALSSLATTRAWAPAVTRLSCTSGVLPMRSVTLLAIFMDESSRGDESRGLQCRCGTEKADSGPLASDPDEGSGGVEPALEMPFEGLGCKTAEIGGAARGPGFAGESGDGGLKDATGERQRFARKECGCRLVCDAGRPGHRTAAGTMQASAPKGSPQTVQWVREGIQPRRRVIQREK